IEAGKVDVVPEEVVVRDLLDDVASPFEAQAADKGLAFAVEGAPDVPQQIITDHQRVAQILRNLLSNALKFTERGQVSVRARLTDEGLVAISVHDTGIGIPREQQGLIFEAFRQADGSTHRKYGGTGLGLSISRDLASLLGGAIAVDSTPGVGSTFTLTLPVRIPEQVRPEPAAAAAVASVSGPAAP